MEHQSQAQATKSTKDRVDYLVEKINELLESCHKTGTVNQYSFLIYYGKELAATVEKDPEYKKGLPT
jgi:hypothetical protein